MDLAQENQKLLLLALRCRKVQACKNISGKIFTERFIDTGICEQHAVTTYAAGLASQGYYRPAVAIYLHSAKGGYDQIVHDVCLQNLPVVFVSTEPVLWEKTEQPIMVVFDVAYLKHVPNMHILAPRDEGCVEALSQNGAFH